MSEVEEVLVEELEKVKAELAALKAALDLFMRVEGLTVQWNHAKIDAGLTAVAEIPVSTQEKETTSTPLSVQAAGKSLADVVNRARGRK